MNMERTLLFPKTPLQAWALPMLSAKPAMVRRRRRQARSLVGRSHGIEELLTALTTVTPRVGDQAKISLDFRTVLRIGAQSAGVKTGEPLGRVRDVDDVCLTSLAGA
jgi:hypothetical protein